MKFFSIFTLSIVFLFFASGISHSVLVNGGFEDGNPPINNIVMEAQNLTWDGISLDVSTDHSFNTYTSTSYQYYKDDLNGGAPANPLPPMPYAQITVPWTQPALNGWTAILPGRNKALDNSLNPTSGPDKGGLVEVVRKFDVSGLGAGTPNANVVYNPASGNNFAMLKTDGPNSFSRLYQNVTLTAGQVLYGYAAFLAEDTMDNNDIAEVNIMDLSGNLVDNAWRETIKKVGDYGHTDWQTWHFTAAEDGTYRLVLRITNEGTKINDSYALFDGIGIVNSVGDIPPPVPEPTTLILFGMGLMFIGFIKRSSI